MSISKVDTGAWQPVFRAMGMGQFVRVSLPPLQVSLVPGIWGVHLRDSPTIGGVRVFLLSYADDLSLVAMSTARMHGTCVAWRSGLLLRGCWHEDEWQEV